MRRKSFVLLGLLASAAVIYLYGQAAVSWDPGAGGPNAANEAQATTVLSATTAANKEVPRTLVSPNDTMTRQLKPCPESPNCVSTQSTQPKKKREPLPFTGSPERALEKLKRTIAEMSRTTLVEEDGHYLHYTFKTWPIPYLDDVEFVLDPAAKVIHYRSASRVGYGDLGVNSRRMKKVELAFRGE